MYKARHILLSVALTLGLSASAQKYPVGGASEDTPSYSEYFSWINNTNEGSTEEQTRINLEFFQWLHDHYGMVLDIYAFDAGQIDGSQMYGSMKSERFRKQFPNGFKPLSLQAAQMGTSLGLWGGPDGFGDTEQEALEREEMMASLVRDYGFGLFKMDAVCGQLRPEKYAYFDRMMTRIREYRPNFVLLNHRLDLGPGTKHSTTFLLGGAETYMDVHMMNEVTAPHHRAVSIARRSPDNLTRLTEDHGVCLSSCLDYWEDELILQAFGRELILAPEIYANPWLLRDDEYAQLAYIFNLHRLYRDILPPAKRLPEEQYGPEAITRGNGKTQFLTLRNLSWSPVRYRIRLDEEVGLAKTGRKVQMRLYHPYCHDLGQHRYGEEVEVEVLPFRSALLKVTTERERDKTLVSGIPYQVVNEKAEHRVRLLGWPGHTYQVTINGRRRKVSFPGKAPAQDYHRQLPQPKAVNVPQDASSLYYATAFRADNNALEVRELCRSGATEIPQVQAARDAFFQQRLFVDRDLWDRNLFDGNPLTAFSIANRWGDQRVSNSSSLYIDLGAPVQMDELHLDFQNEWDLSPLRTAEGMHVEASADLTQWRSVVALADRNMNINMRGMGAVRYVKIPVCPQRVSEIYGVKDGQMLDRSLWRANNLFRNYGVAGARVSQAWKSEFTLEEIPEGSYLCIAFPGECGFEGAWAALKVDGQYVGCPDRAPSFKSNTWECPVRSTSHDYTYYVPLTPDMKGRTIEAWALLFGNQKVQPQVWITAYPIPFMKQDVVL